MTRQRPVHEVVLLDGPAGVLQNVMIHYNYDNWSQFHAKQRRYSQFEGQILRQRGVKPWPHKFVRPPLREFWRRYVTLEGYRDGWIGLKLAVLLAHYYGFMPHWYSVNRRFLRIFGIPAARNQSSNCAVCSYCSRFPVKGSSTSS